MEGALEREGRPGGRWGGEGEGEGEGERGEGLTSLANLLAILNSFGRDLLFFL